MGGVGGRSAKDNDVELHIFLSMSWPIGSPTPCRYLHPQRINADFPAFVPVELQTFAEHFGHVKKIRRYMIFENGNTGRESSCRRKGRYNRQVVDMKISQGVTERKGDTESCGREVTGREVARASF